MSFFKGDPDHGSSVQASTMADSEGMLYCVSTVPNIPSAEECTLQIDRAAV